MWNGEKVGAKMRKGQRDVVEMVTRKLKCWEKSGMAKVDERWRRWGGGERERGRSGPPPRRVASCPVLPIGSRSNLHAFTQCLVRIAVLTSLARSLRAVYPRRCCCCSGCCRGGLLLLLLLLLTFLLTAFLSRRG